MNITIIPTIVKKHSPFIKIKKSLRFVNSHRASLFYVLTQIHPIIDANYNDARCADILLERLGERLFNQQLRSTFHTLILP